MDKGATEQRVDVAALYGEQSVIPFAVYQFRDHRIHVVTVSDGLCELMKTPRPKLMDRFEHNMYEHVAPQDAKNIAKEALRFATEGGGYNTVYREKLPGHQSYQTICAHGQHVYGLEGERYAVVMYDNISAAMESSSKSRKYFENQIDDFYRKDDLAICVISKGRNQVLYTSDRYLQLVPPVKAYDSGVTYWEYFHRGRHAEEIEFLKSCIGKGIVLAEELETGRPLGVRVREVEWSGESAYAIELSEQDSLYRDELTGLTNESYFDLMAGRRIKEFFKKGQKPICLYYDIVDMKLYNTRNGYKTGDVLIHDIALLLVTLYPGALVSRVWSDQFCILTTDEELERRIEKVRRGVKLVSRDTPVEIKAGIYRIEQADGYNVAKIRDCARSAEDSIHFEKDVVFREYGDLKSGM